MDITAVTEKDGALAETKSGRLALKFGAERAIANEQEFRLRHALMNFGGNAQKSGMVLIVRVHTGDHSDPKCSGTAGQRGSDCLKRGGGQRVPDDGEFVARQSRGRKPIGGGLGVAENRITPAEGDGLRLKLRWSHHVPELAMAADDNWHARQASRRDQRQVDVEVESVGNLNLVPAKVTTEIEACAHRRPAIQTAAEAKLGNIGEVNAQWAAAAHASQVKAKFRWVDILRKHSELTLRSARFKVCDHHE